MIDFSRIISFQSGRRDSFEELVCQLARYEDFPERSHSVYKRVDGAGGDGGVEAYWTKPNGRKIGYQAKNFLRSADINWAQIDNSVTQALQTHPELERYVVALPCYLTDRAGERERGKTGWKHWEDRIKNWKAQAISAGVKDIIFVPWTKTELISKLAKSDTKGLRDYFFGEIHLDIQWFENKLEESLKDLGERFNPEDHVDLRIERLFSIVARAPSFRDELAEIFDYLRKCSLTNKRLNSLSKVPDASITRSLEAAFLELLKLKDQIHLDAQHLWDIANWQSRIDKLCEATTRLQNWYWEYNKTPNLGNQERNDLHQCIKECEEIVIEASHFNEITQSNYIKAEQDRIAFVRGNAGTGKSHLLAKCAQEAVANRQPSVLLLGQRFNNNDFWTQVGQTLDLPGYSADRVLGAIDAAGKAAGVRTLFLIDAINEGAGSKFWQNQIASFIHKIQKYSHLCCVISCRSEYFDLAVPKTVSDNFPVFDIRGFETPEEQLNAARVYLDRRGIARPSTPWLSPEFVNPLFLRSVCLSLKSFGKSEIPPGMTGTTKVLEYYLDSVSQNIWEKKGGSSSPAPKLGCTLEDVAGKMLELKQDFLGFDDCQNVIAKHFCHYSPQPEPDWLSVLLNNGVLRKDPNPSQDDAFSDKDVVRFSFQRFQDFLIAEHSLKDITTPVDLFEDTGPLAFCLEDDHLSWDWRGVVDALAVILPEKLKLELVDALPSGESKWWNKPEIRASFAESAKWRDRKAFTPRTLELLNRFHHPQLARFELLLQVSVSSDHPWNAELLHQNLEMRKLPDRDASWTNWLNFQDGVDSSVGVIIEWCRVGQAPNSHPENQRLAAIVLCWFFTSSNRIIRDNATKALANIFLANRAIFGELLQRFAKVDDLYVLERLLAAAFASCCLDPDPKRLETYTEVVFDNVFASGSPPFGLLLRDYALGIIEIAEHHNSLPECVDFGLCKPPYKSAKFRFSVTKEQLKKVADTAGDSKILDSVTSYMEDFSDSTIGPRIDQFLNIPLSKSVELTPDQRAHSFENDVVGHDRKRIEAYEHLKNVPNPRSSRVLSVLRREKPKKLTETEVKTWKKKVADAEKRLFDLLEEDEVERFRKDVAPVLYEIRHSNPELKKFDLDAANRWIAKRAYDYGWTQESFGNDRRQRGMYTRSRPKIERIGKKYQWLALDELLSKIADNYWMGGEGGMLPKRYANPLDIGFTRDIDPTILAEKKNHREVSESQNSWAFAPWIELEEVGEAELPSWPFREDPALELKSLPMRREDNGTQWLVLYENQSRSEKYPGDTVMSHGMRIKQFRVLTTVLVRTSDAKNIASNFRMKEKIHIEHRSEFAAFDEAFLFEAPCRKTWDAEKWRFDNSELPAGIPYAQLATWYSWESDLDAALPDGYSTHLPTAWLARELKLKPDINNAGLWYDVAGEIVFQELIGEEDGTVALLRMDVANKVADKYCTFLSVLISERSVWPGGHNDNAAWRKSKGVCWRSGRGTETCVWKSDGANGSSKDSVPKS